MSSPTSVGDVGQAGSTVSSEHRSFDRIGLTNLVKQGMKSAAEHLAKVTLLVAPWLMATASFADEPYEFYRVGCSDAIPAFEIEAVVYQNVRHVVWPDAPDETAWASHVQSLKSLESRDNLYVFDQWYGYHDGSDYLTFPCGHLVARIEFGTAYREDGPVGSGEPVRMGGRLSIESRTGLLIDDLLPTPFRKIRVYGADDHLELCHVEGCQQKPARDAHDWRR